MTPKMLTLTNILLILAGCHLALGKDSEDDTIRFPSYNEINYSPRIHSYHYKPLISKLRNPSNKARFELPHINNEDENIKKNEIPIDIWTETSHIKDPYELRKYFERFSNQTMDFPDRFGEETKTSEVHVKCRDNCVLEYKRIPIKNIALRYLENHKIYDTFKYVVPKCVEIEQCGGCCRNDLKECGAIENKTVQFPITIQTTKRQLEVVISLERHLKCECKCAVTEDQCSKLQKYHKPTCSCKCTNNKEANRCSANGHIKEWDPKTCQCKCRNKNLECSSGFIVNYETCMCEQVKRRS